MRETARTLASVPLLAWALGGGLVGCSGDAADPNAAGPADSAGPGALGTGAPGGGPGSGQPGNPSSSGGPLANGSGGPGDPAGPGLNPDGTTPGTGAPGGSPTPDGSGAPDGTSGEGSAECPTQTLAPTALRRLTSYEYGNSVRDLLGIEYDVEADLPLDEKVADGYSNNAGILTVSTLHAEKYALVSEAVAALADIDALAPCATEEGNESCALDFVRNFGRKAFRRPITSEDETPLLDAYAAGTEGGSHREGIEVVIRAMLQSPNFVYRLETSAPSVPGPSTPGAALVPLSPYELATRLSFLIWASGPDDALLDQAERGELSTPEQVAATARSMLADDRARRGIVEFYRQWLGLARLDITSKDENAFPSFVPAKGALAAELPAFIDYVLWSSEQPTLRELLTSPVAFVNAASAPFYGLTASGDSLTMVTPPAEQGRSGVLTQPAFLAVQAHPDQTSPVLRGKTIRARFLCQPVSPPDDDVDITVPEIDQGGTARERFSAHAVDECAVCHNLMDPIGFAFETFDTVGQYRTTENGKPIDASGQIEDLGPFVGVRELAALLADSRRVSDCVATEWFRFAAGRNNAPADGCSLGTLQEAFAASGGNLQELIVAMTQTDVFWYKAPLAQEVTQ